MNDNERVKNCELEELFSRVESMFQYVPKQEAFDFTQRIWAVYLAKILDAKEDIS